MKAFRHPIAVALVSAALAVPMSALATPVDPFAFDDQAHFAVALPKSTGGLTRDVILGIHGSAEPNAGIRLDDAIRGVHGSAEPNVGITARDLGTYGLTNGFDTYVGLAPVTVDVSRSATEDWLFGVLYTGDASSFILAKSGFDGLSEITSFGLIEDDPALLSALLPFGFGSDDIRNVAFAQNALLPPPSPVPLPAAGWLLLGAVGLLLGSRSQARR